MNIMRKTDLLKELSKANFSNTEESNFQVVLELLTDNSKPNNNFDFDKLKSKFFTRFNKKHAKYVFWITNIQKYFTKEVY